MRPIAGLLDDLDVGVPPKLLGPERFIRRRVVTPKTTGAGDSLPIRSRFDVPATVKCPSGFRNIGGQCVAGDTIGNRVSREQIRRVVTTSKGGSPSLIQLFKERQDRLSRDQIRQLAPERASVESIRDRPTPIRDQPAPVVIPVIPGRVRTSQFIDLNFDGVDDRDQVTTQPKRDLSRPPGKDFCPTCERQSPKPQTLVDSRPLITDLSPQEARRGSKNMVVGISLAVAAVVALKSLKVF